MCSKKRKSVPQKSPPTATKKLGQDSFVMPFNVRRYFIRSAQPIYGFWFYYIWENVVGLALEDINPKSNPKTASEVDELLATEIGMYGCPPRFSLSTSIICIICIM